MNRQSALSPQTTGWRAALVFALALSGLSTVVACSGGDCDECTQGCCQDGKCVELLSQNDGRCGFGGAECVDCAAGGMTCDATQGMCTNGVGTTPINPGTTPINPGTTPIQSNLGGCGSCAGCCDGATGQCLLQGQPCSVTGTTCNAGTCQYDNVTSPSTPACLGCFAPFQCVQGRCVGPVELCQQSCSGCCTDKGKCKALGSDQSDYACGTGGEQCMDCARGRQVCNEQRGMCEFGPPGDWEICVVSATVDGSFSDCSGPDVDDSQRAPDMYIRFRAGTVAKETSQVAAYRRGGNWVGAWASDRSCVRIDGDLAARDGVTVIALDADWPFKCGLGDIDFTDDSLGHCTLYTSSINPGDSFLRMGAGDCHEGLLSLELKFTALAR